MKSKFQYALDTKKLIQYALICILGYWNLIWWNFSMHWFTTCSFSAHLFVIQGSEICSRAISVCTESYKVDSVPTYLYFRALKSVKSKFQYVLNTKKWIQYALICILGYWNRIWWNFSMHWFTKCSFSAHLFVIQGSEICSRAISVCTGYREGDSVPTYLYFRALKYVKSTF